MGAAILNLMTRNGCRYCHSLEVLLCETIEQPLHVMKSKMAARGKLKKEKQMGDNQILFCPILEYYFHVFQRNVKVDCIFNNSTVISFKSGGFL